MYRSIKTSLSKTSALTAFLGVSMMFSAISFWNYANADTSADQIKPKVSVIADGLSQPWSLAFLPNGDYLVTEKTGRLLRITSKGSSDAPVVISNLPQSQSVGQGGLLDVALHPQFASNKWLYLSMVQASANASDQHQVVVYKAQLHDNKLENVERIFVQQPAINGGRHFGSRLAFDPQGYLYITLGDRGQRDPAQDNTNHIGTVIRLDADGNTPISNPFAEHAQYRPEIFSYGHRNIQGAAINPDTGALWTHEHGPQGGDEINIIETGKNYGWPVITYGVNYGTGTSIGEGARKAGMEQPIHYWDPSIAPSGMTFVEDRGEAVIQEWVGDLLVGALKDQKVVRLAVKGNSVNEVEDLFVNEFGRIRDVKQGPDGAIYLLTDASTGQLIRITDD